jgi:protein ImuA
MSAQASSASLFASGSACVSRSQAALACLGQLAPPVAHQVWCGLALGGSLPQTLPTGQSELDAQLPGGGWPHQALTEVMLAQPGAAEWRLLMPALRACLSDAHPLLAIGCPQVPHAPGLQQAGLPPSHLVWVQAGSMAERLWATEQAIQSSGPGAVIAWLPHAKPAQIRRLASHAAQRPAPTFVIRPASCQHESSAAPLRVLLAPLGPWHLSLQILKRRGTPFEGLLQWRSVPVRLRPLAGLPGRGPHTPARTPTTPIPNTAADAPTPTPKHTALDHVHASLAGTAATLDIALGR